jgi:hypothetical protein
VSIEFSYRNVRRNLETVDEGTGRTADALYQQTISYGGHPNPDGILMTLNRMSLPDADRFVESYLTSDRTTIMFAQLTTAQVGVRSLQIFRSVFRERLIFCR